MGPAVVEVLRHYGVLGEETLHALRSYGPRIALLNARKEAVGSIEPIFHLRRIC